MTTRPPGELASKRSFYSCEALAYLQGLPGYHIVTAYTVAAGADEYLVKPSLGELRQA
jgi:hypothetical protein